MKASLIIPTYDSKERILGCLHSLHHQQLDADDEFEVILVDDGSTDGTEHAVSKLQPKYNLQYIYKPRTSSSCRAAARNAGISKATGDVLIFLDGDQIAPPYFVKEHLTLHKIDSAFVGIGLRYYLEEGKVNLGQLKDHFSLTSLPKIKASDEREELIYLFSENLNNMATSWYMFWTCNVSVRKEHMTDVGGFDEAYQLWGLEDNDAGYRLYKKGLKFILNKHAVVYHQDHPVHSREKLLEWDENLKLFLSKYPEEEAQMVALLGKGTNLSFLEHYLRYEMATRQVLRKYTSLKQMQWLEVNPGEVLNKEQVEDISQKNSVLIIDHDQHYNENTLVQCIESPCEIYYFKGWEKWKHFIDFHTTYRGDLLINGLAPD